MLQTSELAMKGLQPVDPGEFRSAMGDMPGAVTVITSWGPDGAPSGATLSAVVSLSLDPPQMLACFDHGSNTLAAIQSHGRFLVHVLAHGQQSVAMKFSGKSPDKFNGVEWEADVFGLPRIDGCVVAVACELDKIIESGDHKIVIGRVVEIERAGKLNPMVYARRKMLPFESDGANQ
ncbi:flavin reductase family protein [Hyphomicrobium sp.]|uniref:flavin reductase family protein n=1 Tax=Hyphomicrobium sp. TaxID=82 RepID=UPI001D4970B2|nr:flavin reductase family protein [Hyphomicrobium sp.]MBY0558686.1 flavin reductase family protein [Hyphomicrobium sp.]